MYKYCMSLESYQKGTINMMMELDKSHNSRGYTRYVLYSS